MKGKLTDTLRYILPKRAQGRFMKGKLTDTLRYILLMRGLNSIDPIPSGMFYPRVENE